MWTSFLILPTEIWKKEPSSHDIKATFAAFVTPSWHVTRVWQLWHITERDNVTESQPCNASQCYVTRPMLTRLWHRDGGHYRPDYAVSPGSPVTPVIGSKRAYFLPPLSTPSHHRTQSPLSPCQTLVTTLSSLWPLHMANIAIPGHHVCNLNFRGFVSQIAFVSPSPRCPECVLCPLLTSESRQAHFLLACLWHVTDGSWQTWRDVIRIHEALLCHVWSCHPLQPSVSLSGSSCAAAYPLAHPDSPQQ